MKSFMPTLAELYTQERGPMNERTAKYCGNAKFALMNARLKMRDWREAFPDTVDPDKLNRYLLAKAYPKRLKMLMPTWAKVKPIPRRKEFIHGLPPTFPAWVAVHYPNALHFHQSHA